MKHVKEITPQEVNSLSYHILNQYILLFSSVLISKFFGLIFLNSLWIENDLCYLVSEKCLRRKSKSDIQVIKVIYFKLVGKTVIEFNCLVCLAAWCNFIVRVQFDMEILIKRNM